MSNAPDKAKDSCVTLSAAHPFEKNIGQGVVLYRFCGPPAEGEKSGSKVRKPTENLSCLLESNKYKSPKRKQYGRGKKCHVKINHVL